jgi:hypothetical protein
MAEFTGKLLKKGSNNISWPEKVRGRKMAEAKKYFVAILKEKFPLLCIYFNIS